MGKTDFRKLPDDVLEEYRMMAIRLINIGNRKGKVAEIIGCSPRTITNWWRSYLSSGIQSTKPRTRGRKEGEKRKLNKGQEREIRKILEGNYSEQIKLSYSLWTREAVKELILTQYGVEVPVRTISDYLVRWGFTPQKPIQRTFKQQPRQIQKWLTDKYPSIKAKAKKEQAEIQWCDETRFSSENIRSTGQPRKGGTPVKSGTVKRIGASMISATNNMGKMRWMVYNGAMNIDLFIKFLQRVIKDAVRKVFLIVDKLCTHYPIILKDWVVKHRDEIELFYSY
jgi:transposase